MNAMKYITVNIRQKNKAFTVVEFGVTLLIETLFYFTIAPAILGMVDKVNSKTTVDEIVDIQDLIDDFLEDNGVLPDSLDEIFDPVPLDRWGNPFQYLNHDTGNGNGALRKDKNLVPINSDYDLYSMGADGKKTSPLTAAISHDDIIRGRNGDFVGLAIDY